MLKLYNGDSGMGLSCAATSLTSRDSAKNRFTEAASAGYNYQYFEFPNSAFLGPLKTIYSPCCRCSYAALRPVYMRNTSRTLVTNPLFTTRKPSEGKNHEDRNPNCGLA